MASSLFQSNSGGRPAAIPSNNRINSLLGGRSPQQAYDEMMRTNPGFAQFVEANRGKTPDQVAREHGIDPSSIGGLFGR